MSGKTDKMMPREKKYLREAKARESFREEG